MEKINTIENKEDCSSLQPASCRAEVQVLEIENIEDDEEKEKLLQMGIKCVTPGLPKEKLDEETKQEVETVVNDQNHIIKERNRKSISQTESVDDNDEDLYDKYSSSDEIEEQMPCDEGEKEAEEDFEYSNEKAEVRAHVFSSQQLHNEDTRPNKARKTGVNASQQVGSKNKVILKYMGYNANGYSNPQTLSPEYSQYIAMYQQQQMNMQRQKQIHYVQANPQMMHPFYMNNMMINPLYPSQIQYNQAYPRTNNDESNPYKNGNSKRKLEEDKQEQKTKKNSRSTSSGATTESKNLPYSEGASSGYYFNGVIQIANDSFRYEFETLKSQTLGQLPNEISEINKRKFLKICEKSWDESQWLISKREQYSGNSPAEVNAALDVQQRYEKDKGKETETEIQNEKSSKS